jgi:hypothetical protein
MVTSWKVMPLPGSMEDTAASSSRLIRSPSTTRGMKFSSTPKGLNSIGHPVVALRDRHRVFATREEAGFLPGQRGQVRFGQRADHPLVFKGFQQDAHLHPPALKPKIDGAFGAQTPRRQLS